MSVNLTFTTAVSLVSCTVLQVALAWATPYSPCNFNGIIKANAFACLAMRANWACWKSTLLNVNRASYEGHTMHCRLRLSPGRGRLTDDCPSVQDERAPRPLTGKKFARERLQETTPLLAGPVVASHPLPQLCCPSGPRTTSSVASGDGGSDGTCAV
jgi:hypothetical protein